MTKGKIHSARVDTSVDDGESLVPLRALLLVLSRMITFHVWTHLCTLAALELMVKYRISGLPVLDDNNRVVRFWMNLFVKEDVTD